MLKRVIIGMMVVLMMASLASARELEGIEMPELLVVKDTPLVLNGAGVRNVMFLKFYVGGLYLQDAMTDQQAVMEANEPMVIRLHLIDDVDQKTMKRACLNGFKNATGNNLEPIQERVDRFLNCFSEPIKEGDIFNFQYHPDYGLEVYKFDELQDTMKGVEFKEAMFGIWLCDKPADKGLKKAMLAGDVSEDARAMKVEKMAQLEKEKEKMMAQAEEAKAAAVAEKKKAEEAAAAAEEKAAAKAEKMKKAAEETAAGAGSAAEEAKAKAVAEKEKAREAAEAAKEKTMAKAEKAASGVISKDEVMSEDIHFTLGGDKLTSEARQKLDKKAAWLKANSDAMVLLEGHSDARGPKDLNYRLAEERANSVKNYLVEAGVDADRLGVISYGEERPIASGDNKADWRKNRRVHLRIIE